MPPLIENSISDIHPVNGDLGFHPHLLHSYSNLLVIRFAHFLSKKNKRRTVVNDLQVNFPVADLLATIEKGPKLCFNALLGIPPTIFAVGKNLLQLKFSNCAFKVDDFDYFNKFVRLKCLFIL